ncbi:IS200/IS605 family transposase [Yersinia enterocolitica]|uniref:IS200/IS605 family transposase n=1 Tax=Yersinia enterocolitica TaxID=630 RepID=UPI001C609592|nr:IS200/IS605 family transposase [Yersinia enterocolitica]MBW5879045.1 IS200/IS605 family transposase [Yersinia enterocolitica]
MSKHHEALEDFLRKHHSVSKLVVHLIFTTKYRRKLFDGRMIEQLREAFCYAAVKLECEIIEMDGEADHVHLLVSYRPKLAVSVMVNNLKSVSSRMLRQQNMHLRIQSKTGLLWSRSYFACSTGGATIKMLRAYIQGQYPARIGRGLSAFFAENR